MNNFPFIHDRQELWYSRSLACSMIVYRYDAATRTIEVLAVKRGSGCEYNKGKWNVPGGFIDFDEDSKDCAIRECWEETGLRLTRDQVNFQFLDTTPRGHRQTMVAVHSAVFPEVATRSWNFTSEYAEEGEVEEIRWIDLNDLEQYDWTRDQIENIKRVIKNNIWVMLIIDKNKYSNFV